MAKAMTQKGYDLGGRGAVDGAEAGTRARRRTVMQVTWSLVAGGSEMYALTLASGLDAQKYDRFICAVDKGGALEGEVKRRGIPYCVMNRRAGLDFRLMWRLYRLFRRHKVDVVHTHHFNQLFYSFIGAKLAGAKLIHTEHSVEFLKRKRLRIALRLLSMVCDSLTAIGDDGARAMKERAGVSESKLSIIRAGVDPAAFGGSKSEARRELGLDERDRVAVIVARLFPEKNHRLLLGAFADVARRVERARLLIVGDGVEDESIRAEIARLGLQPSVRMMGVRRDVGRILAASDLFVLSSNREGLPIAVLEAMAASRPVVATSVGDLPSVVVDGETGRLVPPQSSAPLACALTEVLADPARASRMGEQARLLVDRYSLRSMIEGYEQLYAP